MYTVQNSIFTSKKSLVIKVVDTTPPVISGPDTIKIVLGKDFNPETYYKVDDFDRNLNRNIKTIPLVDVNREGIQEVTLKVEDSSGNEGILHVNINVVKMSENEEIALMAINQYIADGKPVEEMYANVGVLKAGSNSKGVNYYVSVAKDEVYAIYLTGEVSEFTVLDCANSTVYELLVYSIEMDGKWIQSSGLLSY